MKKMDIQASRTETHFWIRPETVTDYLKIWRAIYWEEVEGETDPQKIICFKSFQDAKNCIERAGFEVGDFYGIPFGSDIITAEIETSDFKNAETVYIRFIKNQRFWENLVILEILKSLQNTDGILFEIEHEEWGFLKISFEKEPLISDLEHCFRLANKLEEFKLDPEQDFKEISREVIWDHTK